MSENRFKIIENFEPVTIVDFESGKHYNVEEVVDLLNSLNDENEQLKKQLSKYDKPKISIFNKDKGDWKWNDNNDIILNIRTGESFYLRNSGAVENLVDLLNKMSDDIEEVEISIKLFEDDVQVKDKKIEEQQATITELKSIINFASNDGDLIVLLMKEIIKLRQEVQECQAYETIEKRVSE